MLKDNSFSNNTTFSEWGKIKHGVHQGLVIGPLLFLLYTNGLLNIIAGLSKQVLFGDNMSIYIHTYIHTYTHTHISQILVPQHFRKILTI